MLQKMVSNDTGINTKAIDLPLFGATGYPSLDPIALRRRITPGLPILSKIYYKLFF